jgi:hypothetical protein
MTAFIGMFNCITILPVLSAERAVFYRERAASMYDTFPYSTSQAVAELPYLAVQALLMSCIAYWLIGFQAVAWKFFYFLLLYFLSLAFYVFLVSFESVDRECLRSFKSTVACDALGYAECLVLLSHTVHV